MAPLNRYQSGLINLLNDGFQITAYLLRHEGKIIGQTTYKLHRKKQRHLCGPEDTVSVTTINLLQRKGYVDVIDDGNMVVVKVK